MFEVLARTACIYVLLLITMRFLGKRMSGQISNLEFAVMIALGAIASSPMQVAQRGVLAGCVLLVVLLTLHRGISRWTAVSPRAERLLFGHGTTLVRDGQLQLTAMRRACVSHQQLFATLRAQDVRQLGEVRRVYLEACGKFTLLRAARPRPGLSVVPTGDAVLAQSIARDAGYACCHCGRVEPRRPEHCPACGQHDFARAAAPADDRLHTDGNGHARAPSGGDHHHAS
jgi:uncharacterized membrane protein YcaP (DUF421 family)